MKSVVFAYGFLYGFVCTRRVGWPRTRKDFLYEPLLPPFYVGVVVVDWVLGLFHDPEP